MKRTRSVEDYLEALLRLEQAGKPLSTTEVAHQLGISKSAATQMASELKQSHFIDKVPYGDMHLTESGRKIAAQVLRRHGILAEYLSAIGVSPETAEKDCCRIEHVISNETFRAIEADLKAKKR